MLGGLAFADMFDAMEILLRQRRGMTELEASAHVGASNPLGPVQRPPMPRRLLWDLVRLFRVESYYSQDSEYLRTVAHELEDRARRP